MRPDLFVYVAGPEIGPIKIGHSASPSNRLKQLEGKAGFKLFLTGPYPVGQGVALAVERYAHWLLSEKHIGHEWFDATRAEAVEAVEHAMALDHSPDYAMPALDVRGRGIHDGVYAGTKIERSVYDRMHAASGGDHAQFIREAVEAELQRRDRKGE